MNMTKWTPERKAQRAIELTFADACGDRAFDDCFENGEGAKVVAAFMAAYDSNPKLRVAVERNARYFNIPEWKKTAAQVAAMQPALNFGAQEAAAAIEGKCPDQTQCHFCGTEWAPEVTDSHACPDCGADPIAQLKGETIKRHAPELLAQLRHFATMIEADHAEEIAADHYGDGPDGCSYCDAIAAAHAIIAKAEGF
ncbi:MAG: hypothetical protein KY445_09380 [Armatimonadetes bacterium]|nr:hypothetical protein [Armatimonadota bacterium]